jgi:hypothetical protein
MMDKKIHVGFDGGKNEGKNFWENLGVDGRKLLKWIIESWDGVGWIGFMRLGTGTIGGLL